MRQNVSAIVMIPVEGMSTIGTLMRSLGTLEETGRILGSLSLGSNGNTIHALLILKMFEE